jgi:NAD(P)-dependent dehydrogenase (short-subunit alcohol dehydrogenase family)
MLGSIVITGASSGIGAALALRYAGPDALLLLVGRDRARLEDVAAGCRKRGARVATATLDVRDHAAARETILGFDEHTPIGVVVASAGITNVLAAGEVIDQATAFHDVIATNLVGVYNVVAPALERMVVRRRGRIGLVSSLAGLRGLPYTPAYSCSKAALRALGDSLRARASPRGVSVTVVYPGFVDTPMDRAISGPKPFRLDAAAAARIIARAIERRRAHCAFPKPLAWAVRSTSLLPTRAADAVLRLFPLERPKQS